MSFKSEAKTLESTVEVENSSDEGARRHEEWKAYLSRIVSEGRAAGDDTATVLWKIDAASAARLLEIDKSLYEHERASSERIRRDGLAQSPVAEQRAAEHKYSGEELINAISAIKKKQVVWRQEVNDGIAADRRRYEKRVRTAERKFRLRMLLANVKWRLRTQADATAMRADAVTTVIVTWFENLWSWFWRSAAVRWTMIFACACAGVFLSFPIWEQLIFSKFIRPALPPIPGRMWIATAIVSAVPFLAACVRVSEEIDIRRGLPWPLHGVEIFKAAVRIAGRSIILIPVTVVAAWIGFKLALWAAYGASWLVEMYAPDARAYLGMAFICGVIAIVAFVIVIAWWLCVKFLTRGTSPSLGLGATSARDAFFDVGGKIGAFMRGALFIAVAGGVLAFVWWQGDYKASDRDIFGLNDALATLWKIGHFVGYGCAIIFAFMAMEEWRTAFKRRSAIGRPSPGMPRADFADEDRAAEAARKR
jgi:hypothetical protein